ncbi:MAG: type II secretion system F family protein [Dehalococcoidia bacterium]
MLLPLIAATTFLSIVLLVMGLSSRRDPAVEARLDSIRSSGEQGEDVDLTLPFEDRVLRPTLLGVGRRLARFLPAAMLASLQRTLTMAGGPVNVNAFLTLSALSAAVVALLATVLLAASARGGTPTAIVSLVAAAMVGPLLPFYWLRLRVRRRQQLILKSLPDALDLVTTSVEAGLGLDAAFARVAEKTRGPFAEELGRSLRETAMGRLRREAMTDLGQRTGVPELITFINAVLQSEQLGVSIAQVLRVQAEQMRTRRRQRAEERAQRAPIYLLFPLVICIFPAFMVIVLGPGMIRISQSLLG